MLRGNNKTKGEIIKKEIINGKQKLCYRTKNLYNFIINWKTAIIRLKILQNQLFHNRKTLCYLLKTTTFIAFLVVIIATATDLASVYIESAFNAVANTAVDVLTAILLLIKDFFHK